MTWTLLVDGEEMDALQIKIDTSHIVRDHTPRQHTMMRCEWIGEVAGRITPAGRRWFQDLINESRGYAITNHRGRNKLVLIRRRS